MYFTGEIILIFKPDRQFKKGRRRKKGIKTVTGPHPLIKTDTEILSKILTYRNYIYIYIYNYTLQPDGIYSRDINLVKYLKNQRRRNHTISNKPRKMFDEIKHQVFT